MRLIPARLASARPTDSAEGRHRQRRRGVVATTWIAMAAIMAGGLAVIPASEAASATPKPAPSALSKLVSDPHVPPSPDLDAAQSNAVPLPARATVPVPGPTAEGTPIKVEARTPQGLVAGRSIEDRSLRTETVKTFQNPDGTHTTQLSSVPVHFWNGEAWEDIDNSVVTDPSSSGVLRNKANRFGVRFTPAGSGVSIDSDGTTFTMTPVGGNRRSVTPIVGADRRTVLYRNVWPGVDLRYRVEADHVKEEIVVSTQPKSWEFPFALSGAGVTPRPDGGLDLTGPLAGKWIIEPPVVLDRNGDPAAAARPQFVVGADGKSVTATVDAAWAASLRPADYPIIFDPTPKNTQLGGSGTSYGSIGGGTDATHSPTSVRVGHDTNNVTGQNPPGQTLFWRTNIFFDYGYNGHFLQGADILPGSNITLSQPTGASAQQNLVMTVWQADTNAFNGMSPTNRIIAQHNGSGSSGPSGQYVLKDTFSQADTIAGFYNDMIDAGDWGHKVMFQGDETPGSTFTFKEEIAFVLTLNWNRPIAWATNSAPTHTYTYYSPSSSAPYSLPSVSLTATADNPECPAACDSQNFSFELSESSNFQTIVASSGVIMGTTSAQWNLGQLAFNKTYWWRVNVTDGYSGLTTTPTMFKTNGPPTASNPDQPPASGGTTNPDGSVSTTAISTTRPKITGTVGVDGQNPPDTVQYRLMVSDNANFTGTLAFDSNFAATPGNAAPWWIPGSGKLVDGGTYWWKIQTRDVDTNQVAHHMVESAVRSFKVDLRLGAQAANPMDEIGPVTVNLATGNVMTSASTPSFTSVGGTLGITFSYNSLAPAATAPSWRSPALPRGWSMSIDALTDLAYTQLLVDPGYNLYLVTPDGDTLPYHRDNTTDKAWYAVADTDSDPDVVITQNGVGDYTVRGADDLTYVFTNTNHPVSGQPDPVVKVLASVTATKSGGPQNAATTYVFDGRGRLQTIKDPLSDRFLKLFYGGDSPDLCLPPTGGGQGISTPLPDLLCRIEFSSPRDASQPLFSTKLGYNGNGDLQVIQNPSAASGITPSGWATPDYEQTNYYYTDAYDNTRRLAKVVSTLANDDARRSSPQRTDADADQLATILTYWNSATNPGTDPTIVDGRVKTVTLPRALQFDDSRIMHRYDYWFNTGDTQPNLYASRADVTANDTDPLNGANLSLTPARVRSVTMNGLGQVTVDTDPAAHSTNSTWWPDDRIRSVTDATGLRTGTGYDAENRVAHVWGPAPSSCFNQEFPTGSCTVPDAMTAYDGATNFVTYDNSNPKKPILPYAGPSTAFPTNSDGSSEMSGLNAAYWTYPSNQSGAPTASAFVGPAISEELMAPTTTISGGFRVFDQTWSSTPPELKTDSGSGPRTNDHWLARLTGEVLVPSGQAVGLRIVSDDGVRVYVDNKLVVDSWGCCPNPSNQFSVPTGSHQIRIDYYQESGPNRLAITCDSCYDTAVHAAAGGTTGKLTTGTALPLWYLNTRSSLVTASRDADQKMTMTLYGDKANDAAHYARDIARGFPIVTVADPQGLNLRTMLRYEDTGPSQATPRPVKKQLPKFAATNPTLSNNALLTKSSYYGLAGSGGTIEQTLVHPCIPGDSNPVFQDNLLWKAQGPDPDAATGDQARIEEFLYDRMGRVTASRAARADAVASTGWTCTMFDDRGRVKESSDRLGNKTTYTYSGFTTSVAYPDSSGTARTTSLQVDLLGRVVSFTDENSATTRRTYDYLGRLSSTWRTLGMFTGATETKLTSAAYDAAGNLTSLTEYASGAGRTTTYTYDAADRLLSTTRPHQLVSTTSYDNQGQVQAVTHKRGSATNRAFTYSRSTAGRQTSTTESVTGRTVNYTGYDGAGRLTQAVEGATTRNYAYDANTNRCATTTTTTCASPTYTFDEADRLRSSPVASAYVYDTYGNLTSTVGTGGNPSMTYAYDGNDHATSINDATNITSETLAPSGRVLRRRVAPVGSPTSYSQDLTYGYDGSGDSPAYQLDNLTNASTPTGIQARSSSPAHNNPATDTTISIPTPGGVKDGDIMIAGIAVRGTVGVQPVGSGWTALPAENNGSSMQLLAYWKRASNSEPASYQWEWNSSSNPKAAAGVITAYRGVNDTQPIDPFNPLVRNSGSSPTNTTSIVAPTVTTTVANQMVVGLFATMAASLPTQTTITPPAGLTERGIDSANVTGQSAATIEYSDFIQPTAGATGNKTATANLSDRTSGMLIALSPATTSGGSGITAVATTTNNASATTLTLTKPGTPAVGDVLIAGIATRSNPTITPPTGTWYPIFTGGSTTGSSWILQAYYHVVDSNDFTATNYTWGVGSTARAMAGTLTLYRGVDTTGSSPIDQTSAHIDSTATTSFVAPGVNTTANNMVVAMFLNTGGGTNNAFTVTPMDPLGQDTFNGSGSKITLATAQTIQTTAGATGNKTATTTASNTGSEGLFTLRPATGGGGGGGGSPTASLTTTITGPGGIVVIDTDGTPTYPLADGDGTIAANSDATGTLTANPTVDEFGKPTTAGTPTNRLGWHGNDQRYTVSANGTIRMGVRLYDPNLGRFLSIDPIEGGCANDYSYVFGDPVNATDLAGTKKDCGEILRRIRRALFGDNYGDRSFGKKHGLIGVFNRYKQQVFYKSQDRGHYRAYESERNMLKKALKDWDKNDCTGTGGASGNSYARLARSFSQREYPHYQRAVSRIRIGPISFPWIFILS